MSQATFVAVFVVVEVAVHSGIVGPYFVPLVGLPHHATLWELCEVDPRDAVRGPRGSINVGGSTSTLAWSLMSAKLPRVAFVLLKCCGQVTPRRQVVRWYRDPVAMNDLHADGLPPHSLLASRYLFTCSSIWLAALIFGRVEPWHLIRDGHTSSNIVCALLAPHSGTESPQR